MLFFGMHRPFDCSRPTCCAVLPQPCSHEGDKAKQESYAVCYRGSALPFWTMTLLSARPTSSKAKALLRRRRRHRRAAVAALFQGASPLEYVAQLSDIL